MSYDVYLQRFEEGRPVPVESLVVRTLLEDACEAAPDEFGYCRVTWGDDEGDLYTDQPGEPIDGLMFNHAGPALYYLMYEIAAAGDMAIIPPDVGPFIVREEQRADLPPDLREAAVVIQSGPELLSAVENA